MYLSWSIVMCVPTSHDRGHRLRLRGVNSPGCWVGRGGPVESSVATVLFDARRLGPARRLIGTANGEAAGALPEGVGVGLYPVVALRRQLHNMV
jgi:hypothetical protein